MDAGAVPVRAGSALRPPDDHVPPGAWWWKPDVLLSLSKRFIFVAMVKVASTAV